MIIYKEYPEKAFAIVVLHILYSFQSKEWNKNLASLFKTAHKL